MQITFDPNKRLSNIEKHGFDFAELDIDFFAASMIIPTKQGRLMAIGYFKGVLVITVVFRPLGSEAITVISMRRASRKERSL
jgi:uncharacterized protein